jgi:hypothetical protein
VEYAINNVTNLGKDNPGAAYDLYAPPDPVPYNSFSSQKWNNARIIVKGDSVEHWSNSVKVVGYKYHSPDFWTRYNVSKWVTEGPRTLTNLVQGRQDVNSGYITEGFLGLQGDHSGKWQIKDLKVTENPCFGPIKADGSVCATTSLGNNAKTGPVAFATLRQGAGKLTIAFPNEAVRNASIMGLDGRLIGRASLSEGGRKAEFSDAPKTGLYFLKLDLSSGVVTQKVNLF